MMIVIGVVFLSIAFYSDITRMKIPNWLTIPITVLGVGLHTLMEGWEGFLYAISGVGAGFGVLFILYVCKAVGAGDVKLFAAVGAVAGVQFTLQSLMYSVLYAGVIAAIVLLVRRKSIFPLHQGRMLRFPFMYAVLPGICTAFLYMQ
ncbi:hypothetical protein BVG16_17435 [Paenibacillus selenitireducens]|uniref:Prepilin type IV endopeptidase peptidase domain-containing protein n=1 Tax=Paenibacillus selenitireducens TaxID=1324314 RepID=A0A1T2XAZ0_9BACL|nr:hypothetical protein BVG16_17435 [Paenibacillus selenitireducens]